MVGIVCLHVLDRGGVVGSLDPNQAAYYSVNLIEAFALCSVNCYALISGYFGHSKDFNLTKILNLWIEVFFYSVLIHSIAFILYPGTVSIKDIIGAFFPITSNGY